MVDELAPFSPIVLGVEVIVEDLDLTRGHIVARCSRGGIRQAISVLDLPLPTPTPRGARWIEAPAVGHLTASGDAASPSNAVL